MINTLSSSSSATVWYTCVIHTHRWGKKPDTCTLDQQVYYTLWHATRLACRTHWDGYCLHTVTWNSPNRASVESLFSVNPNIRHFIWSFYIFKELFRHISVTWLDLQCGTFVCISWQEHQQCKHSGWQSWQRNMKHGLMDLAGISLISAGIEGNGFCGGILSPLGWNIVRLRWLCQWHGELTRAFAIEQENVRERNVLEKLLQRNGFFFFFNCKPFPQVFLKLQRCSSVLKQSEESRAKNTNTCQNI